MAQELTSVDSICFNSKITNYSIDASGGLYISLEGGSITKYSASLDSLFTFSPTKVGNTTLLEASNGLVIFAYYDFFQEYVITDRFLSRPVRTKLSSSSLDYIDLATQSLDNNIWLIENAGFRLIKYNVGVDRIEIETALNTVIDTQENDFTFIKEYHNQVFLVDKNSGIYVFDNLGNFSKKIEAKTDKCSFQGNLIIYLEENEMVMLDLYAGAETRKKVINNNLIGVLKHANSNYYLTSTCLYRTY